MGRTRPCAALIVALSLAACLDSDPTVPAVQDPIPPTPPTPTLDLSCYGTVPDLEAAAADIATAHPAVVKLNPSIGPSWERSIVAGQGHDIFALQLTNLLSTHPKAPVLLVGGLHARELVPPQFLLRFAKHLAEQYAVDPDVTWLLDHTDIRIVPLVNPDGRARVPLGSSTLPEIAWRKNANWLSAPCTAAPVAGYGIGVDLNRNFNIDWQPAADPCLFNFPGQVAGSEPETQAVVQYAQDVFQNRGVGEGFFVDLHAPGLVPLVTNRDAILWPWGYRDPGVVPELEAAGGRVASLVGGIGLSARSFVRALTLETFPLVNGRAPNNVELGQINALRAAGTAGDFIYNEHGFVPTLAFEMGTTSRESCGLYETRLVPRYTRAVEYILKLARDAYGLAQGPDMRLLESNVIGSYAAGSPGVWKTLGDYAILRARSFQGDAGRINRVAYSTAGLPSPQGSATNLLMIPLDGAMGGADEEMEAVIDISALPAGRHLVYAHSEDTEGDWGVVYATWVDAPGFGVPGRAFAFSGRVTDVEFEPGYPASEILPGYEFSVGDQFSGFFAFDPAAQDFLPGPPPTQSAFNNAITAASIQFEGGWAGSGAAVRYGPWGNDGIRIDNAIAGEISPPEDRYWVRSTMINGPNLIRVDRSVPPDFRRVDPAGVPTYMGILLTDAQGTVLSTDQLPTNPPTLGSFESREFYLTFGAGPQNLVRMSVRGVIESLSLANVPSVPLTR